MEAVTINSTTYIPLHNSALANSKGVPDCLSVLPRYYWVEQGSTNSTVYMLKPSKQWCANHRIPAHLSRRVETVAACLQNQHPEDSWRLKSLGIKSTALVDKVAALATLDTGQHTYSKGTAKHPNGSSYAIQWWSAKTEHHHPLLYLVDSQAAEEYEHWPSQPRTGRNLLTGRRVFVKNAPALTESSKRANQYLPNTLSNEVKMYQRLYEVLGQSAFPRLLEHFAQPPLLHFCPESASMEGLVMVKHKLELTDWVLANLWKEQTLKPLHFDHHLGAVATMIHILKGLELAGITHGDIKLENMLTANQDSDSLPSFKLTDFGGAYITQEYPWRSIEAEVGFGIVTPTRLSQTDCNQLFTLCRIRDIKDPSIQLIQLVDFVKDREARMCLATPPERNLSTSPVVSDDLLEMRVKLYMSDKKRSKELSAESRVLESQMEALLEQEFHYLLRQKEIYQAGCALFTLLSGLTPLLHHTGSAQDAPLSNSQRECHQLNRKQLQASNVSEDIQKIVLSMIHDDYSARPSIAALERMLNQAGQS